jgi:uroporphyrinogen-III decarboxylase
MNTHYATASSDELLQALARLDAAMGMVVRRAGRGCGPDCERHLESASRGLRALLGADTGQMVNDVLEAARRVLTSADPAAPLLMLTMARQTLATVVHRHAARATRQVA